MNQHKLILDLVFQLSYVIESEQEMYNLLIKYKFQCIENGFDINKNISEYLDDWEIEKLNKLYNQQKNVESYNEWIVKIFDNKIKLCKLNILQKFLNKWRKKC